MLSCRGGGKLSRPVYLAPTYLSIQNNPTKKTAEFDLNHDYN